jgi:hypothetical protein
LTPRVMFPHILCDPFPKSLVLRMMTFAHF